MLKSALGFVVLIPLVFPQDETPDYLPQVVELPAEWNVGEKFRIELIRSRVRSEDGKLKSGAQSRTIVDFEVVGLHETGYIFQWTHGPVELTEVMGTDAEVPENALKRLSEMCEGLKLRMKTDARGWVEEVENLEEVQEYMGKVVAELSQLMRGKDAPKERADEFRKLMQTMMAPAGLQVVVLKAPQLFHSCSGCAFALHDTQVMDAVLPNPLGGSPIPSKLTLEMVGIRPGEGVIEVEIKQSFDPEKIKDVVDEILERMASTIGRKGLEADLPVIDLKDSGRQFIDMSTGWPVSIRHERVLQVLRSRQIDTYQFNVIRFPDESVETNAVQETEPAEDPATEGDPDLLARAEQGDAEAQNDIGIMYYYGQGVPEDDAKALEWFMKAAEQGHAHAQRNVGLMLKNGYGTDRDAEAALQWFMKAAEQGLAAAQYNVGEAYETADGAPQDLAGAFEWYLKAAEQGHPDAQYKVGLFYDQGQTVAQNHEEALRWFIEAANQGDMWAQNSVGCMYLNGEGCEKDCQEAVKWIRRSADQGLVQAQYNMGLACKNGWGVPESPALAIRYYRKAANKGHLKAQLKLGCMYYDGEGVAPSDGAALKWFHRAAEQGLTEAQYNLAYMLSKGLGTNQNIPEAVIWYRTSAENGDVDAQVEMGRRCLEGDGVEKDLGQSVKWYELAAEQGSEEAIDRLGELRGG